MKRLCEDGVCKEEERQSCKPCPYNFTDPNNWFTEEEIRFLIPNKVEIPLTIEQLLAKGK